MNALLSRARTAIALTIRLAAQTARSVGSAPARWRARGWAFAAIVTCLVVAAYVWKWPIQRAVGAHADTLGWNLLVAISGGVATAVYGVVAFFVGLVAKRPRLVALAEVLGAGGVVSCLATVTGQLVLAEARPREGGALTLLGLHGHGVSGHASAVALFAVSVSHVLGARLPRARRRMLDVALTAWVVVIAASRVYLGMHFLWNVLLGLAIGIVAGWAACSALAQLEQRDADGDGEGGEDAAARVAFAEDERAE